MTTMAGQAAGSRAARDSSPPRGTAGNGEAAEAFGALLAGVLVPAATNPSPPAAPLRGVDGGPGDGTDAAAPDPGGEGVGEGVRSEAEEGVDPRVLLARAGGWSGGRVSAEGAPAAATAAPGARETHAPSPTEQPPAGAAPPDDTGVDATPSEATRREGPPTEGATNEAHRTPPNEAGPTPTPHPAVIGGAPAGASHSTPDRDPGRMDPQFRQRLDRVMERLESEHGIRPRLLEGFRPQLRQEHLYAQGRTTPGPVVTWTLNSAHTQGRAADLKLEGGEESYRIMHRIAGEEGLRTLGMKDPGHLELPRGPGERAGSTGARAGGEVAPAPASAPASGVARVARVARVASAAMPGAAVRPSGGGYPVPVSTPGRRTPEPIPAPVLPAEALPEGSLTTAGWEAPPLHASTGSTGGVPPLQAGSESMPGSTADRVAEVEALKDSAASGPIRRLELRDADGQGTRVRIELRGDTVRTDIRTPDAELARRLPSLAGELEGALERHGLELGRLRVARTPEGAGAGNGNGAGGGESSREEGWRSDQERRQTHRDPAGDQQRQRPRHGGGGKEEGP